MRVFIDSVILIYYLDHTGPLQLRAATRLSAMHAAKDLTVVNDLVRMECRTDPLRKGDRTRLARFDGFFAHPAVEVVPATAAAFDRAAAIRAGYGFKSVDSINLASAVESRCDLFLTNDHQLRRFTPMRVEILP